MSLNLLAPIKYEPKTFNRWVLRFPTDVGIQAWALKSIDAPKIQLNKKEMQFINMRTYVNTSFQWNPLNVTIRDFIAPSQAEALMEWVRLCAESVTGRMGYAVGYAKNLELQGLDPTGVVTEQWLLESSIVTDTVDFGLWDYTNDEVREITFTIQPQKCIHLFG